MSDGLHLTDRQLTRLAEKLATQVADLFTWPEEARR